MRCLWLTRQVPYPPQYGGDYLYSSHLIDSLAGAGATITVICCDNGGGFPEAERRPNVDWRVVDRAAMPAWRSLAGRLPAIAALYDSSTFRNEVVAALTRQRWDAVLIDHIGMGWIVPHIVDYFRKAARRPLLAYVSHNHEESLRSLAATRYPGHPLKRLALRFDAAKVRPLERRLVAEADLVVVNTADDESRYRDYAPLQRFLVLTPGYDGPILQARPIAALPRRAMVIGSFGWMAKQMNLESFLSIAAPQFRRAGAKLAVAGAMPPGYAARIGRAFPNVEVTDTPEDITPHLAATRIGIVPEEVGGGFKHKVLQYVFHRVPVATIAGAVAGTPLIPGQSIIEYADMESLVEGVLTTLDDVTLLERLQDAAFTACQGRYDWAERGQRLAQVLRSLVPQ